MNPRERAQAILTLYAQCPPYLKEVTVNGGRHGVIGQHAALTAE